jgi:Neutral/alkaline non-lysosomal ceramidase, N-terminal
MRFLITISIIIFPIGVLSASAEPEDKPYKAGVATKVITPAEPMWMAGYGNRNKPAEGKVHDLHVKALALEDPAGGKLVLLTSDLVGLPRALSEAVATEVRKQTGLERDRLMLTVSHTHCGPVIAGGEMDMYDLTPAERKKVDAYAAQLKGWMIETIVAAIKDLKPAKLSMGRSLTRFAMNRREPTDNGIINGRNPDGPIDPEVPVLRVDGTDGKLRAVAFGYACHNTTLTGTFYQWCGDYAGFAQEYVEEKHPGAVALYWIGCGADANPLPRSQLEICRTYGRSLAEAVEDVLRKKTTPIHGNFAARYATIVLPFAEVPTKEKLATHLLDKQYAVRARATRYLKILESGGKIDDTYPHYPIQVWRLGDELLWIGLGGEVVVDYSLRLKKELAGKRAIWVTGYANDVMAYIGSARVIKEGGYEADSSMIYYGQPSKWDPAIEEKIVSKVHELVKGVDK